MGTARVDHQKDVIGLVFSQRPGQPARQNKSTSPRPGRARPDGGLRRNELQVGLRRDANWFATAPWLPDGLSRFERSQPNDRTRLQESFASLGVAFVISQTVLNRLESDRFVEASIV
jgi:hypothetical protein